MDSVPPSPFPLTFMAKKSTKCDESFFVDVPLLEIDSEESSCIMD